jgi:hypothetical protein
MKIKENNKDGKDLCETCYTKQLWYLTTEFKCLNCPTEINFCTECEVNGAALKCKTCMDGYYKASDTTCS